MLHSNASTQLLPDQPVHMVVIVITVINSRIASFGHNWYEIHKDAALFIRVPYR